MERSNFGDRLKAYRMRRLWTLRELSEATGFGISHLIRIESGQVKPHDLTIARIEKSLPDFNDAEQVA